MRAQSKQNEITELDKTIATKNKEANDVQADLLHQGMGALGTMAKNWVSGKAAAKDKETAELKAENQKLIKERDEAVQQAQSAKSSAESKYKQKYDADVLRLKETYYKKVEDAVKKQTEAKQKEIAQMVKRIDELVMQNSKLIQEKNGLNTRITARDNALTIIAKSLWDVIANAIKAIIDLALNRKISIFSEFTPEQAAEVKSNLNQFTHDSEEQKAVGYWLIRETNKTGHFTDAQFDQCVREIERDANNEYGLKQGIGKGV